MSTPLNEDLALRVGLAVKELAGVSARELLNLLIELMGEPITHAKLEKLRARKLLDAAGDLFADVDRAKFEKAFALLKGRGLQKYLNPKPAYEPGVFCEISGSLRVACASNSGEYIDGPFSSCVRFLIYQVSPEYIRLIDIREPAKKFDTGEKNQFRANLLKDCALVYTTSIGAPAAAKAIKVGLHPIKLVAETEDAAQAHIQLQKLQSVLAQECPPPWLVKAMGKPTLGVKLFGESIQ